MKCVVMTVAAGCVLWLGSTGPIVFAADTTAQRITAANDPRLLTFATQKWHQVESFSAKSDVPIPDGTRAFFKFALVGDWAGASNQFAKILPRVGPNEAHVHDPAFSNALWVPMHEMFGAFGCFQQFTPAMLKQYADGILGSMTSNSIYFGGTSPGRFVITAVRDAANAPDVMVITQNGLADSRYIDYLPLAYGNRPGLWLPTQADLQDAFQEYIRDVHERQSRGQKFGPDEGVTTNKDGSVTVRSAGGIMAVRGTMAKLIFDHNKTNHDFYAEESFVIPWMYRHLEPHGLIMKLNNEPLAKIDPVLMARDRQFWDGLSKRLLADPEYLGNEYERRTYSKLRSAIAGVYAYDVFILGRTNEAAVVFHRETEAAFKQSIALWPTSPEANFRLAQLYIEQGRIDDAIAVLSTLQQLDPLNSKIAQAIDQLREMKQHKSPAAPH